MWSELVWESVHEIWKARQHSIRKKQVNPSKNRTPVEGNFKRVSLVGWGGGGDEWKGIRVGELRGHRSVEMGRAGEATPSGRTWCTT